MSSPPRPRSPTASTEPGSPEPAVEKPDFTARQLAFIREYMVDLNATEAARRAGYSSVSAERIAYALVHEHPAVGEAIAAAKARRAAEKRVTADRVMEELGRMAFSNIRDYVAWGPDGMRLRDAALLDEAETAAIADIEPTGNGKVKRLKLYDKLAALNALAKHLGMTHAKTALGAKYDSNDGYDAKAELRARLQRIMKGEEK